MGFAKLATVFCISVLSGCQCDAPLVAIKQWDQDRAVAIVWNQTYNQTATPPTVYWFENCSGPHGEPGVMDGGTCVGGYFNNWQIVLPWVGNYSNSELAHELLHAKQALEGIYDPKHETPEWQTLLPLANQNLSQNGL